MFEPSEVIINEESNNFCKKTCLFNQEINNVTLYFNESVTTCENMFYNSIYLEKRISVLIYRYRRRLD